MLKNSIALLIQNLSRTEKAYIKKFAFPGKKEKKNVEALKVFDHYSKTANPETDSLPKPLKNIEKRDFSLLKNLLFDEMMDCLVGYHTKKFPLVKYGKQIAECEILYNKGLTSEAIARMQKTVKEIYHLEEFELLYYALNKLKTWLIYQEVDPDTLKRVRISQRQMRFVLKALEERQIFLFDIAELDKILRRTGSALTFSVDDKAHLREILQKKHYKEDKKVLSFEAAYMRHRIKTHYLMSTGQDNEKLIEEESMLELFEQRPLMMKKHIDAYAVSINGYLNSCFVHKRWEEIDSKVQKLSEIKEQMPRNIAAQINVVIIISNIRKNFYFNLDQNNHSYLLSIEKEVQQIEKVLPSRFLLALWLNMALCCFLAKDWKRSVTYALSVMNAVKPGLYTGMFSMAYMLLLMSHYSSHDLNSLDYVIRIWSDFDLELKPNIARKIANRSFYLLVRANSKPEVLAIFRDLEAQVYKLQSNPSEYRIFDSCGFIEWIDEMKSIQ